MFALVVCPSTVVSFVLVASYTACAKIQGAAEFEVERSHGGAVLRAADYGITPGVSDCTDALNTLLDACRTNGTGRVVFGSGWYNFTSDRAIRLTNLKNFVFDGAGAEFVFFRTRDVNVSGCARLEMRDFTVDWDWGKSPLASLVEVTEATSDHVDFRFVHYGQFPRRDIRVAYTSPWDASTRSVDAQGDRPHGREIALERTSKTAAEQQGAGREGRLGDDGQGYCAEDGMLHATGRWIVRPCVPMGMTSGSWHFAGRSRRLLPSEIDYSTDA